MSQERIEAAAKANAIATVAIAAWEARVFSDEAIERAARALWVLWGNHASDWVYTPPEDGAKTYCMEQARIVVTALKGDA